MARTTFLSFCCLKSDYRYQRLTLPVFYFYPAPPSSKRPCFDESYLFASLCAVTNPGCSPMKPGRVSRPRIQKNRKGPTCSFDCKKEPQKNKKDYFCAFGLYSSQAFGREDRSAEACPPPDTGRGRGRSERSERSPLRSCLLLQTALAAYLSSL